MVDLSPDRLDALDPAAGELLPRLAGRSWSDDAYLAGSAALTLYLAHRPVRSLDFMSAGNRLAPADRRDLLQDLLAIDREVRVETARDGFLYVRTGRGVALRFFYYPYPLLETESECGGVLVASPLDLGLMKLGAIISRGTRRDFADLYLLCRALPLATLLDRSPEKFGHVRDFPLQALKGLSDLSAAESGSIGALNETLEWPQVEAWARDAARALGRDRLDLPG